MKQLPDAFLNRMREILQDQDEFDDFIRSYDEVPSRGLRLNLKKLHELHESDHRITYEKLTEDWGLTPLAEATFIETDAGRQYREFYLDEARLAEMGIRPGKHPYHEAGLYYLQEPSAMQAVMHLDIRPYDRVIDLCASPGGKSTQAADQLSEAAGGFILANEYAGNRARILSSNFERMGIRNGIILNEDTARIADHFPMYFTRVIVDAPCSGEGMFRKDDTAVLEWSPENVENCALRQREIVSNAVRMLAPGGKMSYSTCTFEKSEDEEITAYILSLDPALSLLYEKKIWPHREKGEGHYIAVFRKEGKDLTENAGSPESKNKTEFIYGDSDVRLYRQMKKKDQTYLIPDFLPDVRGLRVLREGILKETELKNRKEPEHAYIHALDLNQSFPEDEFSVLDLKAEDPRTDQYLHGLEITAEAMKNGYCIVACDGAALGLGKNVNGRIKNHYPKGLRFL